MTIREAQDKVDQWIKTYDVKITERYIEAIADFYLYYDKYEGDYADAEDKMAEFRKGENERLNRNIEKRLRKVLDTEYAKKLKEAEEKISAEFKIENAIRSGIRDEVKTILSSSLEHIISKNDGGDLSLNDFEKTLAENLPKLLISYLIKNLISAGTEQEDVVKIKSNLETDLMLFINQWMEKLSVTNEVVSEFFTKEKK